MEQRRASIARMIARTHSATLLGVNAVEVEIECHETPSNNNFRLTIVGLPDASVKEARDRVMAAVTTSGFFMPFQAFITFNLAPADLRKEGPGFDLPLALTLVAGRE
ncbi:MAG: magnesium chelatase domain-containing protein, partial [Roseimicrobium sp.]